MLSLDAIAGVLRVIAPMQYRGTCPAFQSPSSSHLHPCSNCTSTAIRWKEHQILTPPRVDNHLYQQRSAGNAPALYKPPR